VYDARSTAVNREGIYYASSAICINNCFGWGTITGLANLWHVERFRWHVAFTAVPVFYVFCPTSISILWRIWMYIDTHTHISDCIEIVYELHLVPNNSLSEIFLHKLGAVQSVDWIFITGALAWQWLGEYVTMHKTFYNCLFKEEVAAAPVTSRFSSLPHSSRRCLL
jgi:hypothetical protein